MGACCRYRRVSIKFFLRSKSSPSSALFSRFAFFFSFFLSHETIPALFNSRRGKTGEMDEKSGTKMVESFFPRFGREEEEEEEEEAAFRLPPFTIHRRQSLFFPTEELISPRI